MAREFTPDPAVLKELAEDEKLLWTGAPEAFPIMTAENKKGLAFGFRLDATNAQVRNNYELVDGSATIQPYEYGTVSGKLIEAGALVSNLDKPDPLTLDDPDGVNTIRIPAKYVSNVTADGFDFAVRIINIPDHCAEWEIYTRP